MRISLSIPEQNMLTTHGYGQAAYQIVRSLQRLGHQVPFRDPTAPVELNISQPYLWQWTYKKQYKIGLVAWESSKIPNNWKPGLPTCDELWTPSPLVASWFEKEGYPAKVYEHGVDHTTWTPKPRRPKGPVRFLHIGEPAPRKGGQLTYDVFKEVFGNRPDLATLTIKGYGSSTVRGAGNAHPWKETSNVKVIAEEYDEWQMVDLVHRHDVLVYPSYGEGFGLIPLQAMVTGMPTIITKGWAPYEDLTVGAYRVDSKLGPSKWSFHTGQMFHPDREDLARTMKATVDHFDEFSRKAYGMVPFIQRRYDWDRLTARAFEHLVEKFDS